MFIKSDNNKNKISPFSLFAYTSDGTYQDDAFNNLDEDSWDLQEISIKARFQSTNENQEVDDEIHTQGDLFINIIIFLHVCWVMLNNS